MAVIFVDNYMDMERWWLTKRPPRQFRICKASAGATYMTQLLLLGKVEYGGGPIFKVVLEC